MLRLAGPRVLFFLVAGAAGTLPTVAQPVILHVRDCDVRPGRLAVLVVEACQPRPISQGQLCLIVPGVGRVKRAMVTSELGDANAAVSQTGPDTIDVTFDSPSGTVNTTKGPVFVIAFRLDPAIGPGFDVSAEIELAGSLMLDAAGEPVPIEATPGRLRMKSESDPFVLYAFSDYGVVDGAAYVMAATRERRRVADMTVDFEYDADEFPIVREIHVFPDAADLVADVDASEPGHVVVRLRSDSSRLNDLPGSLCWVELARDGTSDRDESEVELPKDECAVRLADGSRVPIETLDCELR